MRKIKNFKIPIYTYDILRKAKKRKIDLFALGLAAQESAKEYIASIAAALEPSTMFDLLTPEDGAAIGLKGGAGTLGVITLGAAFAEKLKAITDPELFRLAETAALIFSETGLKMVTELISQEVAAEGFSPGDLSQLYACPALLAVNQGMSEQIPGISTQKPPFQKSGACPAPETENKSACQSDPNTLAAVLRRLNADKIGVSLNEDSLNPKYSLIFTIPWLAKKAKKSAAR